MQLFQFVYMSERLIEGSEIHHYPHLPRPEVREQLKEGNEIHHCLRRPQPEVVEFFALGVLGVWAKAGSVLMKLLIQPMLLFLVENHVFWVAKGEGFHSPNLNLCLI